MLVKGNNVIFFSCFFFQKLVFKLTTWSFKLFDRKLPAAMMFQFSNAFCDLINPILQHTQPTFPEKRNSFKPAVTDNLRVIIAGSNSGIELLRAGFLKILFGSHKDI